MRKIFRNPYRHISFLLSSLLFAPLAVSSPWEQVKTPSTQAPQSIGSYANGCLAGAASLPLHGEGYQVLRSERLRYYGHPSSVSFIQRLAALTSEQLDTTLLIADMSLPKGGRFSTGHRSHQTGLDIDIWLKLADKRLSAQQLSNPKPLSVVNLKQYKLLKQNWDLRHFELIKLAASDEGVARIFVHPVIKNKLCTTENAGDREWLRKVRPWWGHHSHMHVRLRCPEGNHGCVEQAPPPKGDGCGAELQSWKPKPVQAQANKPKSKPTNRVKKKKVMPEQCLQLIRQQS